MKFTASSTVIYSLILFLFCCENVEKQENAQVELKNIYIGTYTREEGHVNGKAAGIYQLSLDQEGTLTKINTAAQIINPSFLSIDPQMSYLYAVSETGANDGIEGSIHSFRINAEGKLDKIDSVGTGGFYPCHVTTNGAGDLVIASNYAGGAVTIYSAEEGKLSIHQKLNFEGSGTHWRQDASHTHMAILSPNEDFLFVVDLGANVIWNFRLDASSGQFVENENQIALELSEGEGPRHMDFHPQGKIAAVISELSNSISLLSFSQESGVLKVVDSKNIVSNLDSALVNATADIHFHPNGNFLYGSSRGEDAISVFEVMEGSSLQLIQEIGTMGKIPRNFSISEDGKIMWVANQNSDNISVFSIDSNSGKLSFLSEIKDVMTPVCIAGL